jgi:hypothetical protein
VYVFVQNCLSKPRGERSLEHNLLATGRDKRSLGTHAYTKQTDAFCLGTDAYTKQTDAFSERRDAFSKGTSKHDKGTGLGRLLSTSGKTLVCPNGNEFKPANTVIKQFKDALKFGVTKFQIRCKNCDKCPRKMQTWKIFKMLP